MSDSNRDLIIAETIRKLERVSIANDFKSDIKEVSDRLKTPEQVKSFPVCFVIDADESKTDADVNELDSVLEIIISGYVQDHENPEQKLRNLINDIEKTMTNDDSGNPDHELGGVSTVENVLPSDIKTDKGTMKPYGIVDFTFKIIYKHLYGTP